MHRVSDHSEATIVVIGILVVIAVGAMIWRDNRRRRQALAQRTGLGVDHPLIRQACDLLTPGGIELCQTVDQLKGKLERARQYTADAHDIKALRRIRRPY